MQKFIAFRIVCLLEIELPKMTLNKCIYFESSKVTFNSFVKSIYIFAEILFCMFIFVNVNTEKVVKFITHLVILIFTGKFVTRLIL